VKFPSIK